MKFKNKSSENTMSAPDIEEQEALDRGSRAKWVTGLCVILAVALLVGNLPSGVSNVTTVHTKLYSGAIQKETISTVLSGGGILTPQEGQTLSIPQSLEVQARYVSNGDRVSAGDPIAQVDKTAVISAIAELQEVLKELDGDLSAAAGKTNSSSIRSGSAGRVKKIYAQVGTSAADTMYDQGALMLLSLDGFMAAELEGTLPVGQSVTVTLSDGCQLPGTVESITENTSIVTLSDETAPVGDPVTVTGDTGEFLGQGTLYIHSMLRLTGAYGTVSAISVKENQKIYGGTTLISLKDTGHTPEYEKLLSRREELEEQMEMLVKLSKDGILYATDDGLVSGLDGSLPLEALPGQEFTGSVTKINAYGVNSGGNTKYTVTVTIPRQESMLSGMNASVKITTAQSQPLPTVPAEAIVFEGGKSWLYTAYDEKTDTLSGLTEIQTGISDGSLVELRSGLEENTPFYYRCADTIEYSFVG